MVSGEIPASSPPREIRESVASTPGPPALVRIVRRGPFGRGCLPRVSAMSKRSEMLSTRRDREEHTSELQSRQYLVCRLLLEKKKSPPRLASCKRSSDSHLYKTMVDRKS